LEVPREETLWQIARRVRASKSGVKAVISPVHATGPEEPVVARVVRAWVIARAAPVAVQVGAA